MTTTDRETFRRSQLDLYGDPAAVRARVLRAFGEHGVAHPSADIPKVLGPTCLYYRETDDGLAIVLYALLPGTVRITIGPAGRGYYDDAWCYADVAAGLIAAGCWDGHGDPPEGWFRNLSTARRRPGGDPELEYVAR